MTFESWIIFVAIWTAASLPFGPNAANCVVASMSNGLWRGLATVVGIVAAALCHMAVTSLGLSTLLLANATLFMAVKWLGVGYLLWMGLTMIRTKESHLDLTRQARTAPLVLARRGFVISMTNPKAILSYLALFPQFLDPAMPAVPQLAILVPSALVIVAVVYAGYCLLGLGVGRVLSTLKRRLLFTRGVGGFFIVSALGLAWYDPRRV